MLKKIAIGNLGEFWYGDYKTPFEELDGAVPGYPVGVVPIADDGTGRLLCAKCGRVYHGLASHVRQVHGLTAREYKAEVGLLQKSALVSEKGRLHSIRTGLRRAADRGWQTPGWNRGQANGQSVGAKSAMWNSEYLNKTGRCRKQVLEAGRAVLRETGRLSKATLGKRGIGDKTVLMYFGSWDGYRAEVGDPRLRGKGMGSGSRANRHSVLWTDQQLLTALKMLAQQIGRTPSESDLSRYGLPVRQTYVNRFGRFSEAQRQAGLIPNLPVAMNTETEVAVLTAYATLGTVNKVGAHLHLSPKRVRAVLDRYGAPFVDHIGRSGTDSAARREWAADMARRLAGWPDQAAA